MATDPFFFDVPKCSVAQILPADTTALKTVVTAAANGSKVVALIAASTDTSARVLTWGITRSGTFYPLGTINVPLTSGTASGVPAVNLLDPSIVAGLPFDNDGNPYVLLVSGDTLQVQSGTTVTAAKAISLTAIHGDDA